MTALILLGPPGVGKGTQAVRLAKCVGVPAISTGHIFRMNIAQGTELGILAEKYISKGEFVPDSVTTPMLAARLQSPDVEGGFILDGYPRNLEQAHSLRDILASQGRELDAVLELSAPEDVLLGRLTKRAAEEDRSDDTEEVFSHRLEIYRRQTEPIATYYADQDLLEVIDGSLPLDDVGALMLRVLRERAVCK